MIAILILVALFQSTFGLIGYDCGSRLLNITTISLLEVGSCDIPKSTPNITQKYIQLLQINKFLETPVIQCKIEIQRTVYYCGMHSHVSAVRYGEMEYIYEVNRQTCNQVYRTGILSFGNHILTGIKINSTRTFPMIYAGYLNNDGTCNGAPFSDPYGSWESVVVQGIIKVTVQEQTARVDIENNRIYLNSGTKCLLSDTSCVDMEGGYTFWNALPFDNCKFNQYSILYEGFAHKIVDSVFENEETVYSLSSDDITFALASKSKESICGYNVIRTDHPKLVIFETMKGESFAARHGKRINNLDIFAYINSKFVYVERHIRTQIKQLYQDALKQRCNIERQTLQNALTIAIQAPDQFAYNLMKGPGYMAVTAGEVAHIVKCIPVEIRVEHGEHCYAELQVNRRNTTYFLTPRTHILKTHGTKVSCNALLPSLYYIDENWYKILPRPTETRHPTIIQPMTRPTWHYINPASLATSGIYTEKDLEELRDHIMFPVEKSALLNDVAREMHGYPINDKE